MLSARCRTIDSPSPVPPSSRLLRLVDAVEALEDPLAVLGADPRPVVPDLDARRAVRLREAPHDHVPPGRRVLHGVVDEVLQDPPQALAIGHDRDRAERLVAQRERLARRLLRERGHHVRGDVGGARLVRLRRARARLEARQLEQVLDQRRHAVRVRADLAEEALGGARLVLGAVLERLHEAADGRERRAQLVRGVGHEVAAHRVEPLALGRVVEGQHGAVAGALGAGERHARDRERAPQLQHLDLELAALAALEHVLDERSHLGLADRLQVVAPERRGELQRPRQAGVGERHDALVVDREDAVVHRGEDGVGAAAVARDLRQPPLQLVGRLVDDPRELAELVLAPHADARREVAGGELARGVHDLGERAPERGREQERRERRRREREQARDRRRAPQLAPLRLDAIDAAAEARDADHAFPRGGSAPPRRAGARPPWRCVARRAWAGRRARPSPPGGRRGSRPRADRRRRARSRRARGRREPRS